MVERDGEGGKTSVGRRAVLLSIGTGIGAALAGCSMLGDSSQSTLTETEPETETPPESTRTASETATETSSVTTPRVSETETKYWWYTPHPVSATKLDRDDPVAFEDLSDHWQVVVANAITRSGYPLDHNEPRGPSPVRYEGSTFDVGVGAVLATDPKKTPGGAGWREPLSLTATVEDGSFVVSVTNEADEPIPVHHYERPSPYFSILVAVSDDPKLLTHDGYDHMKALRTEDVVRIPSAEFWARKIYEPEKSTATRRRNTDSGTSSTDTGRTTDTHRPTDSDGPTDTPSPTATDDLPPIETLFERRRKSQITQLDPGQTLRESYGLPSDLPPESTVWLSLPIGGESTDVTGGREWTFTATTTLRA